MDAVSDQRNGTRMAAASGRRRISLAGLTIGDADCAKSAGDLRRRGGQRQFQFDQRMFYRVGFQVVQGAASEADAIEGLDNAPRQVGQSAQFDLFGQVAAGRQGKFVGRLRGMAYEAAAPQAPPRGADRIR